MVVYEAVLVGQASSLGDDGTALGQANAALTAIVVLNLCGVLFRYRTPHAAVVAVVSLAAYIIANGVAGTTDSLTLRVYLLVCGVTVGVGVVYKVRNRELGHSYAPLELPSHVPA